MKSCACLWLLLLLLLPAGCGSAAAPSAPAQERAASLLPLEMDEEEEGLAAAQLEEAPRPLMEEEILSAYYRAEEAYGWFDLAPLPDNGEIVLLAGTVYRRVDYPGIEDSEDLRTYLRGLFSPGLTDQLLAAGGSRPLYQDIDGALYVSFPGRIQDGSKGAAQVEVVQVDAQTYSLEVSVDLLDSSRTAAIGLECWSFPYAYMDGRWVFTDFQLVS